MPTYDYQCRSCRHTIEVIHSMLEQGPTTCERCGGELRRVFHPTGIIFKGSGFYKTDSRAAATASASTSAPKAATGGESKPSGGGDSSGSADASGGGDSSGSSAAGSPSSGTGPASTTSSTSESAKGD